MSRTQCERIGAAAFYVFSSFSITIINKTILTTYNFPSFLFLGLGQILATILTIQIAKWYKLIKIESFRIEEIFWKIFPLPVLYLGNMMLGLGSTKSLSLPMFNALRKLSSLMTMGLEFLILGSIPGKWVQVSVIVMFAGDLVAALNDLGFNALGYFLVLGNDVMTALQYVYTKQKLSADFSEFTLIFYNSIFILLPSAVLTVSIGNVQDIVNYSQWSDPIFVLLFVASCFMGFFLIYSCILCTSYNTPLTTTVVGSVKNIFTTYVGMFVGGDYIFSLPNFIGLNVSVIGTVLFTYVNFKTKRNEQNAVDYKPLKSEEV